MRRTIVLPVNGESVFNRGVMATVPAATTLSSVTPGDSKNILVWTPVSGATDYWIYFDTSSGITTSDSKIETGSTDLTYTHTSLANGTTYYYKVVAVGPWGITALSNELSGEPGSYINDKSLKFDGVDEYLDCGNNFSKDTDDAFSYSFWIKPRTVSVTQVPIGKKPSGATNPGFTCFIGNTGKLRFAWRTGVAGTQLTNYEGNTVLSALTWYHVAITYDGSKFGTGIQIYVDGSAETMSALSTTGNNKTGAINTDSFAIGAQPDVANPYDGWVDEVTLWDIELSSTEVSEIYNSGIPTDPINHSQFANLAHYWKNGDDDTFPTIIDHIGSADGTMTNMENSDIDTDTP